MEYYSATKNEWSNDTWLNMMNLKNTVEWKKPDTTNYLLYDSIYTKFLE
jgi:hypothetical protein